jgi:ring-1,2-phenylacetyl-CoA epoxidase subunit PaaC
MQAALNHLWPYTREFWTETALEQQLQAAGVSLNWHDLAEDFQALVDEGLAQSTLRLPVQEPGYTSQGKQGIHSEHLTYLLTDLQSVARAHPGAQW